MKTIYKILIIILTIHTVFVFPFIIIGYTYDNIDEYPKLVEMLCPYFLIPEDFTDRWFPAMRYGDPIKQLEMIKYHIEGFCYHLENGPRDVFLQNGIP